MLSGITHTDIAPQVTAPSINPPNTTNTTTTSTPPFKPARPAVMDLKKKKKKKKKKRGDHGDQAPPPKLHFRKRFTLNSALTHMNAPLVLFVK